MEMVQTKTNYFKIGESPESRRQMRMDIRDERVRLTRRLCTLKDIEFWEPETLTEEQKQQMIALENKIAELRELEEEMKA